MAVRVIERGNEIERCSRHFTVLDRSSTFADRECMHREYDLCSVSRSRKQKIKLLREVLKRYHVKGRKDHCVGRSWICSIGS